VIETAFLISSFPLIFGFSGVAGVGGENRNDSGFWVLQIRKQGGLR